MSSSVYIKPAGRYINRRQPFPASYQALMASFGDQLVMSTDINLMLPPTSNDSYLCEYPSFLKNLPSNRSEYARVIVEASKFEISVALLVKTGHCSTETKARVLFNIQRDFSDRIWVLVLYQDSGSVADMMLANTSYQQQDWNATSASFSTNSSVVYLSPADTAKLLRVFPKIKRGNPALFQPGNSQWEFIHSIEGSWRPTKDLSRRGSASLSEPTEAFFWVRYVLFALLILTPIFRTIRICYRRGGRILFRRDENGRINAIQFIP